MSDIDFYTDLPVQVDFSGLADPSADYFAAAPDDWVLAVTDVERSTDAIETPATFIWLMGLKVATLWRQSR